MSNTGARAAFNAKTYKWDFFIAHAGRDTVSAERLYDALSPVAKVFLDIKCLKLGDEWDRELALAQRSSRVTLILISKNTDTAYYKREEIATAIALSREDRCSHRVVPVYLDPEEQSNPPYGLRRLHSWSLPNPIRAAAIRRLLELVSTDNDAEIPNDHIKTTNIVNKSVFFVKVKSLWDSSDVRFKTKDIFIKYASLLLAVLGLAGLAENLVEWKDFFDYGVIRHYIEVRTWLLNFLPVKLPGWVGDYLTLGLGVSHPLKGIVREARKNIPTLQVRLEIAEREERRHRPKLKSAEEKYKDESGRLSRMEQVYGQEMAPPHLSEKEQLRYTKEKAARMRSTGEARVDIDKHRILQSEVYVLKSRIDALSGLIKFVAVLRYWAVLIWPVLLVAVGLFMTGIIRGFDRNIVYSFLMGLCKILIGFIILLFVTVDFKRTFIR